MDLVGSPSLVYGGQALVDKLLKGLVIFAVQAFNADGSLSRAAVALIPLTSCLIGTLTFVLMPFPFTSASSACASSSSSSAAVATKPAPQDRATAAAAPHELTPLMARR